MINKSKNNINSINQKLTAKIFDQECVSLKKEQIELLNSSFLSHKENRINIMFENINKNNIGRDKLKDQKVTLAMLNNYQQKDDLPLKIQDAIMREFAGKILANLNEETKQDFDEKFDSLLRSRVKIDIKTLEEFKPYIKGIDKDKLAISNENVVGFLNDNKITNINPIVEMEKWGLYDQSVFMELLAFENKDYFDRQNTIESTELAKMKGLLTAPNLDNRTNIPGLITRKQNILLDKTSYEKIDIENNIKQLDIEIKKAKELGNQEEIDFLESKLGLEISAFEDMKKEDEIIKNLVDEIKNIDNVNSLQEIIQKKDKEIETLEKNGKLNVVNQNKLDVLYIEIKFLENIKDDISKKNNIEDYIANIKSYGVLKGLDIDENELINFTRKLYNLKDKEENLSISSKVNGSLNFAMSKNFDENNEVNINIDLNKSDKETVTWLEDSRNHLTNQNINKNGMFYSVDLGGNDIRLADGYKIKIDDKFEGYLDSSIDSGDADLKDINIEDYPNMFDEEGEIKSHVSILCDENGNKIKDNDGKYIFINHNKCERKIDIVDKKITIKGDQIDIFMQMFVAWNKQKPGMKGLKNILKIDENDQSNLLEQVFEEILENGEAKNNDGNTAKNNINIGEPSQQEIMANTWLDDEERLVKSKELLEKIANENDIELNPDLFESGLLDLVLFAHYSTVIDNKDYLKLDDTSKNNYIKIGDKYYELGKDGERVAGIYNYTKAQLKEKIKILQSTVGFENWQIKALLKYGLCGIDPNSIQDKAKGEEIAKEWIEDQIRRDEDDDFDIEHAKPEAVEAYNKLGEQGKKSFIETLKKYNTGIEKIENSKVEIIEELKNQNSKNNDGYINNNQESEEEGEKHKEESEKEKFDKKRKNIEGYKFLAEKHDGFIKGTRLFINIGESLLPPEDVPSSFLEVELVDVSNDEYFSVKIIGSDVNTNLDGKIVKLPRTDDQLTKMSAGGMYKMPASNRSSWDDCLSTIENTQMFDKVSVFGSGPTQTMLKGGKLLNGKNEEITHFCRTIETYDIKEDNGDIKKDKMGQTSVVISYKVTPLKNGKIKVNCNFIGQDKEEFTKNVKYKHEKEMDYTSFMILMETKQLYGKTKEQKSEIDLAQGGQRDPLKGQKARFFSIMSVVDAVKGVGKNITGKLDEYKKEQQEDFQHLLCSHEGLNIYSKMGSFFGMFGGLFEGMENSLETAGLEYYADREGRTWKKIEKWLNLFEKDPHFSSQWSTKLAPILMQEGPISGKNDYLRYQYAAAFLFLLKKDGPWSRMLAEKMGKGFWIEKFLGPKHKTRFLEMQEKRKNELEEYKKLNIVHRRQPRQTELSKLEFEYMVGVIDGRQPFGGFLGDDEHYQASKWSRSFAEKIQEGADSYFGGFDEKYKKIGRISFRQAEQEWFRHMSNMRPHKALPFLKAMAVNAQSGAEEDRTKAAILGAMLTGVFKNMQDENLRSEFWRISRTMGFLPGLWIRDTEHQENIVKMLDGITGHPPFKEKFSKETGYEIKDYQIDNLNPGKKFSFLLNTFPRYWKANGTKILEVLQFQEREEKNSIIKLAETGPDQGIFKYLLNKSREYIREDIDNDVAGTYGFYEHSPLTANKGIVSQLMPSNGKFDQSDNNMKEAAQMFWTNVGSPNENMIPTKKTSRGTTEFIFGKYFNWLEDSVFSQGNLAFLIKGLALVKKLKQEGKDKEADYYLRYTIYGQVAQRFKGLPSEFANAMNRFLKFFEANIDFIDEEMISSICENNPEASGYFKKPFEALDMKEFWEEYMSQTTGNRKSKYKAANGQDPDRYINWQIEKIYRDLTNLNITPVSIRNLINSDENKKTKLDEIKDKGKDSLTKNLGK